MRKYLATLAVLVGLVGLLTVPASAAPPVDLHCPDHNSASVIKIEGEGTFVVDGVTAVVSGATVTFNSDVEFCVKASTQNSGVLIGTDFTVNWLTRGGQTPGISYVVIYGICPGSVCEPQPS